MRRPKELPEEAGELNLYLVRHGQTEGNVQRSLYRDKADHAIRLTAEGVRQANEAGAYLARILRQQSSGEERRIAPTRVWYSPYYRARETAGHILRQLFAVGAAPGELSHREEPFLIEQKAGIFDGLDEAEFSELHPDASRDYDKHVRYNGRVYAISPMGESRLDVVIRCKHFFGTLIDDFRTHGVRNVVVVSHGVTLRAFVMAWMRYSPEWFDAERNPGNCWIRHLHGARRTGYVDEGYIFGENAPLRDPAATQRELPGAGEIFMLQPDRRGAVLPKGVSPFNPFDEQQKVSREQ
jgi:broad specificity phosphatase PhoE